MAETVTMPKLGFDMAEGTLVRWVIGEGDAVQKGQVLAEIETDKATVEVESTYDGVMLRHLVSEGDVIPIGDPIAYIGEEGEEVEAAPEPEKVAEQDERFPPGAFTQKEVADEKVLEREMEAGVADEKGAEVRPAERPVEVEAPGDGQLPGGVRASPVARRMADERGVDLRQIHGSGPQGRIVKKDIEGYLERGPAVEPAPAAAPAVAPAAAPAAAPEKKAPIPMPAFAPAGPPPEDQEVPLSRLRAAIGRRMVESKQQLPHFYVTHEYNMAPVLALRKQINAMLGDNEKVSVNDFVIKAVALGLRAFPNLNATFAGDKVIRHGPVNIGVAVAVEGGLLTVVVQDADRKPLRQISAEVRERAQRARDGKVRPDDVEGSTFTISNLGMFDVEDFIAIINPPEAAILAVGSAREVPVVENGEIKPGIRMKATISVDHRVSDGAEAAQFLQVITPYLEEPMRLLL